MYSPALLSPPEFMLTRVSESEPILVAIPIVPKIKFSSKIFSPFKVRKIKLPVPLAIFGFCIPLIVAFVAFILIY